ncbi:MAG TPA: BMP family ABC transporter substrate-binding protein [Candidatus Dorea gallistercoris]|uniref:BMP family ABC transporter substrate-binding protein n=1 Tax=Candidatus Dorea gallistercoris TaxID=2838542 RepID=A0A9D1UCL9_9FIRM|nr:BMP family ABC transporter substrate-binding protein [Candidatus Dorea gallistercoris]
MGAAEYEKAYKLGKKEYQHRMMKGLLPTLKVLDEILPTKGTFKEMPLGVVQIPMKQIVGTKTGGRSSAFAANFMPILRENTEFAHKWSYLSTAHENEGIRDPIKAYEYMNEFYVEEGNKRVSVMKYYGVVSVPGSVTRIIPKRTDEKENKIYYEFLDFYELSKINYIWFSKVGSFPKLQKAVGKGAGEVWDEEEKLNFSSLYSRFEMEYEAKGGEKLSITTGDAFLALLSLYDYETLSDMTTSELRRRISKSWEEFELLEEEQRIDLKMNPSSEKKPILSRLFSPGTQKQKIAFLYEKTPGTSAWTYAHELGRLHLEQTFPEEVQTIAYSGITKETADNALKDAISKGCNLIFTTTPAFIQASVKAAIDAPEVRIVNCSLNTSHRYIRTYYSRMYEAKFLMGAIAGAMAENDRLAYLADYPIYGEIANINAFALGAKMINPRVKVYLEWSTKKDHNAYDRIRDIWVDCVSGKDMVIPEESSRYFGLYRLEGDYPRSLAMPLWHWGKFYEQMIRKIMDGTWKYDDKTSSIKAINYWWGMSSGVVDIICSQNLPLETKKLTELLKHAISSGQFHPFSGILYSQTGQVQDEAWKSLSAEEIITMDWLADNVIGSIPAEDELIDRAKAVVAEQGVRNL